MSTTRALLLMTIPAWVFLAAQWNRTIGQPASGAEPQTAASIARKSTAADDFEQKGQEIARKDRNRDGALDRFMRQKLAASSRILEGLMTEDFTVVAHSADRLLAMSKEERWRASNDMMYLQHSTQFRNAVANLHDKAEQKSIDGVSLAWVNVTMSCIKCHEWVRNVVVADLNAAQTHPAGRPGE